MCFMTACTRQLLAGQRSGATANDTPPGFGWGCAQGVACQVRGAKLHYPSKSTISSMRRATSPSLRPLSMAVLRSFS